MNLVPRPRYQTSMIARMSPGTTDARTRRGRRGIRLVGALLAVAFLFSGDLVRIHGHADGAPASTDCAACVVGLSSAVEAAAAPALALALSAGDTPALDAEGLAPHLPFVRHGGLRDPPAEIA